VIFLDGVGVGKTHLASALGYTACLGGHSVLFISAIDVINNVSAAHAAGQPKKSVSGTCLRSLPINGQSERLCGIVLPGALI
jgi:DNA replication protein DnaC